MDIIKPDHSALSKPTIEQVQKQKEEYKLIGNFLRTRGLKLFAYNPSKDEVSEMTITKKTELHVDFVEGEPVTKNQAHEEVSVDSRNIHFEALNMGTAMKRVKKYKEGKIKDLCNLRKPDPNALKFW